MSQIINEIRSKKFMTFDCYGTLMDWETGFVSALKPILERNGMDLPQDKLLELYAKFESEAERGEFKDYKTVLRMVMARFFERFQINSELDEDDTLIKAFQSFQPFPDTVAALQKLSETFTLGVISNVDLDIFKYTANELRTEFSYLVTSEEVGSYKPALENFKFALRIMGATPAEVVHVAQSAYHDIPPASILGITTVHVARSYYRSGFGATPEAGAKPDLVVEDLEALVELLGDF